METFTFIPKGTQLSFDFDSEEEKRRRSRRSFLMTVKLDFDLLSAPGKRNGWKGRESYYLKSLFEFVEEQLEKEHAKLDAEEQPPKEHECKYMHVTCSSHGHDCLKGGRKDGKWEAPGCELCQSERRWANLGIDINEDMDDDGTYTTYK